MTKRAPLNDGMRFALRTLRRLNQIASKVPAEQLAAALLPHKRPGYCQFLGDYLLDVAGVAGRLAPTRHCAHCSAPLSTGHRADARYCDQLCRQKAWRKRHACVQKTPT